MPVSAAQIEQLSLMVAAAPNLDDTDLSALQTIPEVIGYVIACARHDGDDEVDAAELLIRFADLRPDDVRAAARVLGGLGYIAVAEMMRRIAGRRRYSLAPLAESLEAPINRLL
jgi:hypothetical protein